MMTAADIDKALAILKRWRITAVGRQKADALSDVVLLERVIKELTGRK